MNTLISCRAKTALAVPVTFLFLALVAPAEPGETDAVAEAFRLRMGANYQKAEQILAQELEKSPNDGRAWFELARLKFHLAGQSQDMESSQEAIEKAVEVSPETGLYHCWDARIAVYNGILKAHANDSKAIAAQFKRAGKAAEKAVALDPDDHAARIILTSLYGNNPPDLLGDKELAEKHVRVLEERSPIDGASARCELSCRGDGEGRLAVWSKLAAQYDADSRFHRNLAREFARAGKIEEAQKHTERALELDPKDGKILMDLFRTCALNKKFDAAGRFARRYLDHEPPGPLAYRAWTTFALAKIKKMNGDNDAAEKFLKEAKTLDSGLWFTMTPPPEELFDEPSPAAP